MKKKWLIGLVLLVIVAQAIRPSKNEGVASGPKDITRTVTMPKDVAGILKKSCYDCHSNYTNYHWYDRIAPASWWVASHIKDGKRELNFTLFNNYSTKKQLNKLEGIREMVENGEMPLKSYLLLHGDARLTNEQKSSLVNWTHKAAAELGLKP